MYKLKSINIDHFRNHSSTKIPEFEKVTIFVGPSGSGKSSILSAIKILFSGKTTASETLSQIQEGNKIAIIQGTYETGGKILNAKISLPPQKGDCYIKTSPILSKDIIDICLSRKFLYLDKSEQKALIVKTLLRNISPQEIFSQMDNWSPEWKDIGKWYQEEIAKLINEEPYSKREYNIETMTIDDLYSIAYAERTIANRKAKEESIKAISYPGNTPSQVTQEDIKKIIESINLLKTEIARKEGEKNGKISYTEWKKLETTYLNLAKEIDNIQEEITKLEEKKKEYEIKDLQKDIAKNDRDYKNWEKKAFKIKQKINTILSQEHCPPGSCAIKEIHTLQKEYDICINNATNIKEQCKQLIKDYNESIKISDAYNSAVTRLKKAKETYDNLPQLPTLPQNNNEEIIQLNDKLMVLEAKLEQAKKQKEAYESYISVTNAKALSNKYDAIVKMLEPGGIPIKLLGNRIKDLEENIRHRIDGFYDMDISISPNPWCISATPPESKSFFPIEHLSYSEQTRICVVIQEIISESYGLGIIGIDEHGLDPELRIQLLVYLLRNTSNIQTVIFSTSSQLDHYGRLIVPKDPKTKGVILYNILAGNIERGK